jgi:hypothetical protein
MLLWHFLKGETLPELLVYFWAVRRANQHTSDRGPDVGATQAKQLCHKFRSFFTDKLRRIGSEIQMRPHNYTAQRLVVCRECATSLDTLAPVR